MNKNNFDAPTDDNPKWTPGRIRAAVPLKEAIAAVKRKRGGQPKDITKRAVSLRLDPDVLAYFQRDGRGWQTRINAELKRVAHARTSATSQRSRRTRRRAG
jgi:uncharacterized protein (DUF4415 family)